VAETTFSAEFLGCKVSRTDLDRLRERLEEEGYRETGSDADIHVVNGCCVTAEALSKTRSAVRRGLDRADTVLITGCAARLQGHGFDRLDARVRVVAAPSETAPDRVVDTLAELGCRGGERQAVTPARRRMFLKVQDGCSFACAYCVIPDVRGPTRSRPLEEVLEEAARRVRQGHREIVVTGVNVGLYRDRNAKLDLPGLLCRLGTVEGLERIRLSSIEPNHLTDDLLDVLAQAPYLPHLHVPLQTGADKLLTRMRRRYRAADYADRVAAARQRIADVAITADVMAGLPGESDEHHAATLELIESLQLARLHVFPYSPRPGTATAADDTDATTKRERAMQLRQLSDRLVRRHRARHIGRDDEVLIETTTDGRGRGQGRDGSPWLIDDVPPAAIGGVVPVGGTALLDDGTIAGRLRTGWLS